MKEATQAYTILLWGPLAMFNMPETKVESYSYDVPTYSAMRGLLRGIYWHPGVDYEPLRIDVLHPIRYETVKVNEVAKLASRDNFRGSIDIEKHRSQRTKRYLYNVRYRLTFRLTFDAQKCGYKKLDPVRNNIGKYKGILERKLARGASTRDICFGTRECTAVYKLADKNELLEEPIEVSRDFGVMFYDWDYTPWDNGDTKARLRPKFMHGVLNNGVMLYPEEADLFIK